MECVEVDLLHTPFLFFSGFYCLRDFQGILNLASYLSIQLICRYEKRLIRVNFIDCNLLYKVYLLPF